MKKLWIYSLRFLLGISFLGLTYASCFALVTITDDGDGVPAATENLVPNPNGNGTGDGNGDGTDDFLQGSVTSLQDITGSHYVTLENTGSYQQTNVRAVSPPADAPPDITFPYGMFEFNVSGFQSGSNITMKIMIPKDTSITGYWKKNATTSQWENIASNIVHGPPYAPTKTIITFTIRDGGPFDEDGSINGEIVDQGGPGAPGGGEITAVPTINMAGMVFFFLLVLGTTVYMKKKTLI